MVKESITYTGCEILIRGVRLLLIPLYLTYLTKHEFGLLQQILIVLSFVDITISLCVNQCINRLYFDYKLESEKENFLGNVFGYLSLSYILAIIIIFILDDINKFTNLNLKKIDYIFILGYSFLFQLVNIILCYCRIKRQLRKYIFITAIMSIGELLLILILMVTNWDVGMVRIYGGLLSCFITIIIYSLLRHRINMKFNFNREYLTNYFKFAYPLIIIEILGWFLVSYDKIMISKDLGIASLAIYGLAIQITSISKLIQSGFLKTISIYIYEKNNDRNLTLYINKANRLSSLVSFIIVVSFIATFYYLSPHVLPLEYQNTGPLIYAMLISKLFLMMYAFNLLVLKLYKNTKLLLLLYAVLSLIFYASCKLMIPTYGLIGGIYANIITTLMLYVISQVIISKKYNIRLLSEQIVIIILTITLIVSVIKSNLLIFNSLIINILIFGTFYFTKCKNNLIWSK